MKSFGKVLLIDDDQIANLLHRILLEKLNIAEQIIIKSNGVDALEFIKQHCIDTTSDCANLILLDINMPIMNGIELLQELKTLGKSDLIHTRIVVLTSSGHPEEMIKVRSLGVKNIFQKPLTKEIIMAIVYNFDKDDKSFFSDKPSS